MSVRELFASAGSTEDKQFVEDVFTSYLRTGTGADVTVTTDIDMTKGYMLWSKGRSGATDHAIYDSARGVTKDLVTNSTAAETTQATGLKSVSTTGHTIGSLAKMNTSSATYVDWVMRKAPKFFDVVTWTGDGTGDRTISHSLGIAPGMIITKTTNRSTSWVTYHVSLGNTSAIYLNATAAADTGANRTWNATATTFQADSYDDNNAVGITYIAYLFAHDTSTDGIIQCGSFTTDGSGNATVELGWEPQYVMTKISSTTGDWNVNDDMRGWPVDSAGAQLKANTAVAEANTLYIRKTPTGLKVQGLVAINTTFIYLAIRRPMKVPTSGTEVYNAIARTGTGAVATVTGVGFAPDLVIAQGRGGNTAKPFDRLRGVTKYLVTSETSAEQTVTDALLSFDMNGISVGADSTNKINLDPQTYINHFFKRAKGFMDIVCYTGTGVARTVNHNLGVVPELMIVKSRVSTDNWTVYVGSLGGTKRLILNLNLSVLTTPGVWNNTDPTDTLFTLGTDSETNYTGYTYVAYLFATLAGVQWINSYVGDGTTGRVINCGFTSGARFICIKATSTTGNWWVFDSSRGILAAADPVLALNSTAAEITSADAIDPHSSGFIVNQEATCSINASGVSYLVWAIA